MSLKSVYFQMSLLAIFFMTLHLTDDVIRNSNGAAEGGIGGLFLVLFLALWLYGLLRLAERRSGYILSLLGSLMASFITVAHLMGLAGDAVPGEVLASSGPFFVWVIFALGMTSFISLFCAAFLLFSPAAEIPAAA